MAKTKKKMSKSDVQAVFKVARKKALAKAKPFTKKFGDEFSKAFKVEKKRRGFA